MLFSLPRALVPKSAVVGFCGVCFLFGAISRPAAANDGGIAFGGSPRLLAGHKTIAMKSEMVRVTVEGSKVTVDCRFVFQNDGPACVARMGFPDRGRGASDPDEEYGPTEARRRPAASTFDSFQSWVDGKPVKTELIRADKPGDFWHAKVVSFPAHGRHVVRDLYTVALGGQIMEKGDVQQTFYVLHTGSSWHGPIGRTEVSVTFRDGRVQPPLRPVALKRVPGRNPYDLKNIPFSAGLIVYRGPSAPVVAGRSLHFVRTNWRPAYTDDILLYFGYRRSRQASATQLSACFSNGLPL